VVNSHVSHLLINQFWWNLVRRSEFGIRECSHDKKKSKFSKST